MIPVSQPSITEADVNAVTDAVKSGWVSSIGAYIEEFEQTFARFCGVKHCIAVSNGTVAIHLALKALGIGAGDEVIVPDLTFVATANAVVLAGAVPVLADVRNDDWCLDAAAVERVVTQRTRAIIPVHLYGQPCEMGELAAIARKRDLRVIEDAAEAHGATYGEKRVGSLGDCATFSFYGNKIITTGEGGAITTDSDEIAERTRFLRDHGMSKKRRYWHSEIGYNYRITNLQAALGVSQLNRIEQFLKERQRILDTYRHYLEPSGIRLNPKIHGTSAVNWMTCVYLEGADRTQRDSVIGLLRDEGIDSRPFFFPLSFLPMYETAPGAVADALSAGGLNLPTFPGLDEAQIARISSALLAAIDKLKIVR